MPTFLKKTNFLNILWTLLVMVICALILTAKSLESLARYLIWGFTLNQFIMIVVVIVGFGVILMNSVFAFSLRDDHHFPSSSFHSKKTSHGRDQTKRNNLRERIRSHHRLKTITQNYTQSFAEKSTRHYLKRPLYLSLGIFLGTFLLGVIYNLVYVVYDAAWIDVWSGIHISICVMLTLGLFYWTGKFRESVLLLIIAGILFEVIEYYVQLYVGTLTPQNTFEMWLFDYPAESWINYIADIPFNLIGILLGYIWAQYVLKHNERSVHSLTTNQPNSVFEKAITEATTPTSIISPEDLVDWIHSRINSKGNDRRINALSSEPVTTLQIDPLNKPLVVIPGRPAENTDLMPITSYYKRVLGSFLLILILIGILYLIESFYPGLLDLWINYVREV